MSKVEVGRDYVTVLYDLSPNYITKLERFVKSNCVFGIYAIANTSDKCLICYFRLDSVMDPSQLLRAIHKRNRATECDYLPSEYITKLRELSDVWEYGKAPI